MLFFFNKRASPNPVGRLQVTENLQFHRIVQSHKFEHESWKVVELGKNGFMGT